MVFRIPEISASVLNCVSATYAMIVCWQAIVMPSSLLCMSQERYLRLSLQLPLYCLSVLLLCCPTVLQFYLDLIRPVSTVLLLKKSMTSFCDVIVTAKCFGSFEYAIQYNDLVKRFGKLPLKKIFIIMP